MRYLGTNKTKIVFLLSLCFVLLSSCTYRGALKQDFYTGQQREIQKIPATVVISDSGRYIMEEIKTSGGFGRYRIKVNEGMLGAVNTALSDVFEKVLTAEEPVGDSKPDFLVETFLEITLVYKDTWSGTQVFESDLGLIFLEYNTKQEVARYFDKKRVSISPSGTTNALGFLTGASLFLLSPITVPAAVQSAGTHGVRVLEQSLTKSLKNIVIDVERDKRNLLVAKSRAMIDASLEQDKTPQLIPSKYEDFLNSVVVIRNSIGTGTGFFITKDGYIITNSHVVDTDSTVSIKMRTGKTIIGQVMSTDINRDLALIRISGDDFSWLTLGKLTDSGIGNDVIAIGTPKGLEWSISKGIISAVRVGDIAYIQTDAAINTGNSGGPLISLKDGKVIGVNTFMVRKDISEGLNFAVSAQEIYKAFPQIKNITGK